MGADRKSSYRWLFAAIVAVIVIVLAFARSASSQNSVRSLLRAQAAGGMGPENEGFDIEARIVASGDAAVPELIEAIRMRDSLLSDGYARIYARLPDRIERMLPQPVLPRQIRAVAMQILTHHFESRAKFAIPALIALSHSADPIERDAVVAALCELGSVAIEARPRLVELLNDPDEYISIHAARALGQFDGAAPELRRSLQSHFASTNSLVYREALEMYPRDEEGLAVLVPALKEMLSGRDRQKAAFVVGFIKTLNHGEFPINADAPAKP